jgi:hypothetical protein
LLTDSARDLLSVVGFVITVVGTAVTIAGLVYAVKQIRKTQSAAEAARVAVMDTLAETRKEYQRYAGANAHRYFGEVRSHVDHKEWEAAARRVDDLADVLAQLVSLDAKWTSWVVELRKWAGSFKKAIPSGQLSKHMAGKWRTFRIKLQGIIDTTYGPFHVTEEGSGDDKG